MMAAVTRSEFVIVTESCVAHSVMRCRGQSKSPLVRPAEIWEDLGHTGPNLSSYGAPLLFLIAAALQWNVMRAYTMIATAMA